MAAVVCMRPCGCLAALPRVAAERRAAAAAAAAAAPAAPRRAVQQQRRRGRSTPLHVAAAASGPNGSSSQGPLSAPDINAAPPLQAGGDASDDATPASSSLSTAAAAAAAQPPYAVMTALAAAGAAETAYLTAAKLAAAPVACPASGACESVLSSPYAELFGLPLPLFGAGAYAAVAALAGLCRQAAADGRAPPPWANPALAAGVGALATTSGVLMYVLATALGGAPCVWCYGSAALSAALLACLVSGLDARGAAAAAAPGLGASAGTLAALYIGLGGGLLPGSVSAAELDLPYVQPAVTAASPPRAAALAARLKAAGATMYGAFWCTHCLDQKQAFGADAMRDFPYVECFPEGWRKGVKLAPACEAASVKAFPTWVVGGRSTEGQLELDELAAMLDAAEQQQQQVQGGGEAAAAAAATAATTQ